MPRGKKYLNPFDNITDIQPGISPEILDEIATPETLKSEAGSSWSSRFFGSNNKDRDKTRTATLDETTSHSLYEKFQILSSKILPSSNHRGNLTSLQFVQAGDYLILQRPEWEWSFNPDKMILELPPDKQYLVCRGLQAESFQLGLERVHYDFESNQLWSCPDYELTGIEHLYDISLTYDSTNRTPRIWVVGYESDGSLLPSADIIKDMNIEFVGTVATLIPHHITDLLNVSIHPCRHAEFMGKIINELDEYNDQEYLVYFLKIVDCIFPSLLNPPLREE